MEFTAVRHIRLGGDLTLNPGDDVPKDIVRRFRLKRLYQRKLIGPKGHGWTKWTMGLPLNKRVAQAAREEQQAASGVTINRKGGGRWSVSVDGEEVAKGRGAANLDAWLAENGHAEQQPA
jgi:hypothetical protein|tara:strand:+ start:30873 stop:31232 length:360 start_codon:yes stop_codon:yes gene_type:complete